MIEYFRLNIEYLRSGGSILKRPIKKMTERSNFHKYSIFNSQFSAFDGSGLGMYKSGLGEII